MTVDTGERQLLAQFLGVPVVRLNTDRALEQERFVQTIELLLNHHRGALASVDFLADSSLSRLPDLQHRLFQQPHVAWCWLEEREFFSEEPFEAGFRNVHCTTARAAVVVGVVLVASSGPTAGETTSARLAAYEAAQRKVGVRSFAWRTRWYSARQDRLDAIEQFLRDQRVEVATFATNAVLGHIHNARVQLVAQQHANRL